MDPSNRSGRSRPSLTAEASIEAEMEAALALASIAPAASTPMASSSRYPLPPSSAPPLTASRISFGSRGTTGGTLASTRRSLASPLPRRLLSTTSLGDGGYLGGGGEIAMASARIPSTAIRGRQSAAAQGFALKNTFAEGKTFPLIVMRKSEVGLRRCFGRVGENRVCMAVLREGENSCSKNSHVSSKHSPTSEEEYGIPARGQNGTRAPTVLATPAFPFEHMLDSNVDVFANGQKSTLGWIDFFEQSSNDYAAFLRDQEVAALNGDTDDDEELDDESDQDFGEETAAGFAALKITKDEEFKPGDAVAVGDPPAPEDIDLDAPMGFVISTHHSHLKSLFEMVKEISLSIPLEGLRLAEYQSDRFSKVTRTVNLILESLSELHQGLGPLGDVLSEGSFPDFSAAVLDLMRKPSSSTKMLELEARVTSLDEALEQALVDVSEDIVSSVRPLVKGIAAIVGRVVSLEQGGIVHAQAQQSQATSSSIGMQPPPSGQLGSMPGLQLDLPLLDSQGVQVGTLGSLLADNVFLKAETTTLRSEFVSLTARLDKLAADILAQGGSTFREHTFSSEADVTVLSLTECPQGDAFALYADPLTIFCHDGEYDPTPEWKSDTRGMEREGSYKPYQRKFTCTNTCRYPYHYSEGKALDPSKPLAAFKTKATWSGEKGIPGRRKRIMDSLQASRRSLKTNIHEKLPAGSELRSIAEGMAEHVVEWYADVHAFFDEDLQQLIDLGIPEEDALILLSEYFIIMMDRIYLLRQNLMEFSLQGSDIDYQTRCIWVALQVHQEMDSLVKGGLRYNSSLSVAFIRFLTVQTGSNVAAGVGPQLKDLESKINKQKDDIKEAKTKAVAATKDIVNIKGTLDDAKKKGKL